MHVVVGRTGANWNYCLWKTGIRIDDEAGHCSNNNQHTAVMRSIVARELSELLFHSKWVNGVMSPYFLVA